MATIEFSKLNGLGNDFVFVNALDEDFDLTPEQVAQLCDRHFGIGGDGVIIVRPPRVEDAHAFMDYRNSDGTIAQMCGNGVRCFAKYLVDRSLIDVEAGYVDVDTRAGIKHIVFETDDTGRMTRATVDMGNPILAPSDVPTTLSANAMTSWGEEFVKDQAIDSPVGSFKFTCVSMGNPHAVCFIDDWDALSDGLFTSNDKCLATFDVAKVGAFYESCSAFPEKANIEFAAFEDDGLHMRVYERGCGETLACGTGTCATGVAALLTGRAGTENDIRLLGGTLHISYEPDGHVFMTGAAAESFSGSVEVD